MLVMAPGQSATVLVALAMIGGTPNPTSAGKTSNIPPPAIALAMPASTANAHTTANCEAARWGCRAFTVSATWSPGSACETAARSFAFGARYRSAVRTP